MTLLSESLAASTSGPAGIQRAGVRRVALVGPDLEADGGVQSVVDFFRAILIGSGRYHVDLISLATSASDADSRRALVPSTWSRRPTLRAGQRRDVRLVHAGCNFAELEFQRYKPRAQLTSLLNTYDVVQVVAGTPAWALVARHVRRPVALQVATLACVERRAMLTEHGKGRVMWRRLMAKTTQRLDDRALKLCHTVFVENAWMYEYVSHLRGGLRVVLHTPGIDTDRFAPVSVTSDQYILSVGRFADSRKNVRMLFDAYATLVRTVPQAPRLVLAGATGPTASDMKFAASLGIAERLEIRINVSANALLGIYQNALLFVLSSDEEGLGIAILEAMACGLPVVSTRCGGPEMIVRDGTSGFLVERNDSPALAGAMQRIVESEQVRMTFGSTSRRIAVEEFSHKATAERFLTTYDAIVVS